MTQQIRVLPIPAATRPTCLAMMTCANRKAALMSSPWSKLAIRVERGNEEERSELVQASTSRKSVVGVEEELPRERQDGKRSLIARAENQLGSTKHQWQEGWIRTLQAPGPKKSTKMTTEEASSEGEAEGQNGAQRKQVGSTTQRQSRELTRRKEMMAGKAEQDHRFQKSHNSSTNSIPGNVRAQTRARKRKCAKHTAEKATSNEATSHGHLSTDDFASAPEHKATVSGKGDGMTFTAAIGPKESEHQAAAATAGE